MSATHGGQDCSTILRDVTPTILGPELGGSTRVGNASFLDVAPLCYSVHSGPELRTGGGKKRTRTILKVRGNFLNVFRVENFLVFFFSSPLGVLD